MASEALPQKYRPRTVGEIVGQDVASGVVTNWLNTNQVPQALCISGVYSSGKTTLARVIAQAVNCEQRQGWQPCGQCPSCLAVGLSSHPCIHEMNAADKRGIDVIRELSELAWLSPRYTYRVFILDEVHQFTREAFGAFLKVLEEPPPSTMFILCTTEVAVIPDMILSRCAQIPLQPISTEACTTILQNVSAAEGHQELTAEHLTQISEAVGGHPRDALHSMEQVWHYVASQGQIPNLAEMMPSLLDRVLHVSARNLVRGYAMCLLERNAKCAVDHARSAINQNRDVSRFMIDVARHLRAAVLARISPDTLEPYMSKWAIAAITKAPSLSNQIILYMASQIMDAYERSKSYTISSDELLELVTLQLMDTYGTYDVPPGA